MHDCPEEQVERGPVISVAAGNPIAFLDACRPRMDDTELCQAVRQSLEALPGDGILKILVGHRPKQLVADLATRGHRVRSRMWEDETWDVEISGSNTPEIVDLRRFEAPEPLQRVLLAAAALEPGETFLVRLPHVPHPLFPLLDARKLRWWVHEEPDHSALVAICRPGAA